MEGLKNKAFCPDGIEVGRLTLKNENGTKVYVRFYENTGTNDFSRNPIAMDRRVALWTAIKIIKSCFNFSKL